LVPEVEASLALLDRDHDVVDARLEQFPVAGLAFHQAAQSRSPDARDRLLRLADALDAAASLPGPPPRRRGGDRHPPDRGARRSRLTGLTSFHGTDCISRVPLPPSGDEEVSP